MKKPFAIILFFVCVSCIQAQDIETTYFDKYWMSCSEEDAENYKKSYASDYLWIIEEYNSEDQILSSKKYLLEDKITKTGTWSSWHANGRLSGETTYDKEGNTNGPFEMFNEEGSVILKGQTIAGENDGKWIYYYKNGRESAHFHYELDSLMSVELWNRDGTKISGDVPKQEDIKPTYPGGEEALLQDIYGEIIYPEFGRQNNIEGLVVIGFKIQMDGSVTNLKVKRSVHPVLDKEALRVVLGMKQWVPGKLMYQDLIVEYNLPVRFKLEGPGLEEEEQKE